MKEGSVRLRDGRTLAYAEYGTPQGRPLFWFHGTPGSRLQYIEFPESADLGLRVIAVDRPGCGLSDRKAGRTVAEWPADVAELADALGVDRYYVAGASGGGPYSLACAA